LTCSDCNIEYISNILYTVRRPVAIDCNQFSNGFQIFLN
jgi:hypothetical protein